MCDPFQSNFDTEEYNVVYFLLVVNYYTKHEAYISYLFYKSRF